MAKRAGLLKYLPPPLLDDLVASRWLPIVGAGMSRNADMPLGKRMPGWDDVGRQLAESLDEYTYSNALDAVSAFEQAFSRAKLVERLYDLLYAMDAKPGKAHRAFCGIPFDIVCTTNWDNLLEQSYEVTNRYCHPVLDEDQLAIPAPAGSTALLKLHGDLRHPSRMIATESDYDRFIADYPLCSTFLSNLLITRTAVLIGYSLDDSDLRQIWRVISSRLGQLRRPAYALLVGAKQDQLSRFARRNITPINLPSKDYATTLTTLFEELSRYYRDRLPKRSTVTNEASKAELALPDRARTRLCLFTVPASLLAFYRKNIFPVAEDAGFVPTTPEDVISPGGNTVATLDAIVDRAAIAVVDATSSTIIHEMERIVSALGEDRVVIVATRQGWSGPIQFAAADFRGRRYILRSNDPIAELDDLKRAFADAFHELAQHSLQNIETEPRRLLQAHEYRAAVISATSMLEAELRRVTPQGKIGYESVLVLARRARELSLLDVSIDTVRAWLQLRNHVLHAGSDVDLASARKLVEGIERAIIALRERGGQSNSVANETPANGTTKP